MLSSTKSATKTVLIYSILIISSLSPGCLTQQLQAAAAYPNTYFQGNVYNQNTNVKGYGNNQATGTLGSYSSQPIDGQYWTGYNTQYPQYQQQYGDYQMQSAYPQNGGYTPYGAYNQYGGYPQQSYMQQYGYATQNTGYNSYAGQYPAFDAGYWSGAQYYNQYPVAGFQHPGYQAPRYMPSPYPAGYKRSYRKPFGKGFLGGTGSGIAKGLLGAVLIGAVAGKVAKGK